MLLAMTALFADAGCGRIHFDERSAADARGPACGPAYADVAGLASKYRVSVTARSWLEAEAECELDGGHLVTIGDAAEDAYVTAQTTLALGPGDIWIGLSDHAAEGTMRWVTGEALVYTNWEMGEPNDFGGDEDCAHVYSTGLWNDSVCPAAVGYMCECDRAVLPAPPTYCDTDSSASCGSCGMVCTAGTSCSNQVCVP
jgi:hypothetical protein